MKKKQRDGPRAPKEPLTSPQVTDLNNDALPEILMLKSGTELWMFDHRFTVQQRRYFGPDDLNLGVLPDLDGDGIKEIMCSTPRGAFLLDPALNVKAAATNVQLGPLIRQGSGIPPYVVGKGDTQIVALRMTPNRWYLINRYGPGTLWVFGLGALVAIVLSGTSLWRRTQAIENVQRLALDTQDRGVMLIDPDHRIRIANATLHAWFDIPRTRHLDRARFQESLSHIPELAGLIEDIVMSPPYHAGRTLTLDQGCPRRDLRVTADPVPFGLRGATAWLVCFEDRARETEAQQARVWTGMARQVAHDLKNPLTSILLTLQQLQMKYKETAPDQSPAFDSYVNRITERIEHLRRMSRNFMKFIDLDRPNLVPVDFNAFIREVTTPIARGQPSDITIDLQPGDGLPGVRLDRDQIQSVVENLIANAVEAMPDGGRITVATSLAQKLRFPSDGNDDAVARRAVPPPGVDGNDDVGARRAVPLQHRDYLILDVRDTGCGISEAIRTHLFEPGGTTSDRGRGLGLVLVKKIVSDHGGHIEVESEVGMGTVFTVYLPV